VAAAGGQVFVLDGGLNQVFQVATGNGGGAVSLAGGQNPGGINGQGGSASFRLDPDWGQLALDSKGGLFLTDTGNDAIREVATRAGNGGTPGTVSTLAGLPGNPGDTGGDGGQATFDKPGAMAVSGSHIYLADLGNNSVRVVTLPPTPVATRPEDVEVATLKVPDGTFGQVQAVAVDSKGMVYVSDAEQEAVYQLTPPNLGGTLWTPEPLAAPAGGYSVPAGVAVDSKGDVYVADSGNQSVYRISGGEVTALAPEGGFAAPWGVAVDGDGNVYVTDLGAEKLYVITPDGAVHDLAGSGATGSADGDAGAASFNQPQAVAVAEDGTLLVADTGNNLIRAIALAPANQKGGPPAANSVSTLVGAAGLSGTLPGQLPASLFSPRGIAAGPGGMLLIAVPDAVMQVD